MKLFHASTIYEESWLLLGLTKLLGIYPIKFFRTTYINYIYVTALIISFFGLHSYLVIYTITLVQTFLDINESFITRKIRYLINMYLFPVIIISSMRQSSTIRKVFEQIDTVDKNIQYLNTEIDHNLCMKNDIVNISTVIFIVMLSNLMDYYGLLDNDKDYMYFFMWMLDRIPDFINVVVICSFGAFINKIKFRFGKINAMLNTITNGKHFVSTSETSDRNNIFRYRLLKLLHLELCKAVSLVNEAYGFRCKILSMVYITYASLQICVIYVHSNNYLYVVDVLLAITWGTLDIIKLAYLINLYHSLRIEYT